MLIIIRPSVVGFVIGLGLFSPRAEAQSGFRNWNEFANWCRSTGGNPLPNPPRCMPRQQIAPPQPSESQPPGPHLIRENGKWAPKDGYDWVSGAEGDFRVRWVPGKPSNSRPHIVASEREDIWSPKDGYEWASQVQADTDFRVRWVPNKRSNSHPNVVTTENEGRWLPEDGFEWSGDYRSGDLRVKWVPNKPSNSHPNVVANQEEGSWRPRDGYDWLNEIQANTDFRVRWVPNRPSDSHPNVVTTENEGRWRPEEGYNFLNPGSGDLIVVDNGRVADAIRTAKVVVSLNEQIGRFKELSRLEQYGRVEDALKILATKWVVAMPLVASAAQRQILIEHTKGELRDLLKQVLQASVNQMSNDVRKLTPYVWNPFASQKRQLLEDMDRDILTLEKRAEHEIAEGATFRDIRSGSQRSALQYDSGQALSQLLDINNQRRWAK